MNDANGNPTEPAVAVIASGLPANDMIIVQVDFIPDGTNNEDKFYGVFHADANGNLNTITSNDSIKTGGPGNVFVTTSDSQQQYAVNGYDLPLCNKYDNTPAGHGVWEVATDGGVFTFGNAGFFGSKGGQHLNKPMVGIAVTSDGGGYWTDASDGGVFTFGDAPFYGSKGGQPLNQPVVGMAPTPDGLGYWLVAADGGVFTFGDAGFYGSKGGQHLNKPVVGMAATPTGNGYWLVASDGGIFTFGDAGFYGSKGGQYLNKPVVGMAATPDARGYWLDAADGGVFTFGDATFYGSDGSSGKNFHGMSTLAMGYTLARSNEIAYDGFGPNGGFGADIGQVPNLPIVGIAAR